MSFLFVPNPPLFVLKTRRNTATPASPASRSVRLLCAESPLPQAADTRVCRVCKQRFELSQNGPRACRHHTTMFTGRLLRVSPTETSGIGFFYDCCGADNADAPGCTYGFHHTYDD